MDTLERSTDPSRTNIWNIERKKNLQINPISVNGKSNICPPETRFGFDKYSESLIRIWQGELEYSNIWLITRFGNRYHGDQLYHWERSPKVEDRPKLKES
jgi:hypothetical protein